MAFVKTGDAKSLGTIEVVKEEKEEKKATDKVTETEVKPKKSN